MSEAPTEYQHPLMLAFQKQLACGFPQVAAVFEDCMAEALAILSRQGIDEYLESAHFLCKMGRGVEPVLIFLEEWPSVAKILGESALPAIMAAIRTMWKSPNSKAIIPFLQTLAAVARRLPAQEQIQDYLDLALDFMERTTGSIHGIHKTFASPGLPDFFQQLAKIIPFYYYGDAIRNLCLKQLEFHHVLPDIAAMCIFIAAELGLLYLIKRKGAAI